MLIFDNRAGASFESFSNSAQKQTRFFRLQIAISDSLCAKYGKQVGGKADMLFIVNQI